MGKQTKNEYLYSMIENLVESITIEHHAVFEHEYKTDEQLKTRASIEHKDASCFNFGKEEIVEMIVDAIYDDAMLLAWLKSPITDAYLITAEHENCSRKFIHLWKEKQKKKEICIIRKSHVVCITA